MPSPRLDSHRNSVQNGVVERFTAFTATIFVPNLNFVCHRHFSPNRRKRQKRTKKTKLRKAGQVGEKKNTISNPGWVPDQIRKIGLEWAPEVRQNIGNPYQTEDNKNPRGRREALPPCGAPKAPLVVFHLVRISYVLHHFRSPFWDDFPNLVRDPSRI